MLFKIADVIKYEGNNKTFIYKHEAEDFNCFSQLIVHESQEAVLLLNGQAADVFGPGRYTLETKNIPILGRLLDRAFGDTSPFHCEVYFVNKAEQMAIKWGTDSKVQYIDPVYGFPLSIGACGEMSLRVTDSRTLLTKLVGTENYLSQEKLAGFFRAFLMTKLKSYVANVMREEKISIFEVDERLIQFSQAIKTMLVSDFSGYGISLEQFFVTTIAKPDGEKQYEKFKELHFRQYADVAEAKLRQQTDIINAQTEAQKVIIESQALAAKRAQEGYTYQQERGFDVASKVAENEASGQFANMGIGLGMMTGIGGNIADIVSGSVNEAISGNASVVSSITTNCKGCGAALPENAKFCMNCGEKVVVPEDDKIVCPICNKTVLKGKFCMECGYKFISVCPKCSQDIIPGAKFCLSCGEKL